MDALELSQCIQNPEAITAKQIDGLRRIMEAYPAFQTVKMLYLKALWNANDASFPQELEKIAIALPDRRLLYGLMTGQETTTEPAENSRPSSGSSFDLIDAFLNKSENAQPQTKEMADLAGQLTYESSASVDYLRWQSQSDTEKSGEQPIVSSEQEADSKSAKEPEAVTIPAMKHQDLIDSFLESKTEEKGLALNHESEADESAETSREEIAIHSLDNSFFTETLARIYIKQKRYDKALQIIKNLSLKYPEKNVYFADQIRFLEKLIINIKK